MIGFLSYDLAEAFALGRNKEINFPFLKENGELLSISHAHGLMMEPRVQELYKPVYSMAANLVELYPQYYRFLLGIVLDLEDLGMAGTVGEEICQSVRRDNLLAFDTSDIRRLEAMHLLNRRLPLKNEEIEAKQALEERIRQFTLSADRFFKFNRPLFYDLTHFVFFLTDYGRNKDTGLTNLVDCLLSVGFLSILDNDIDLLSEAMICLKYIGEPAPEYWKQFILEKQSEIKISFTERFTSSLNSAVDDYHVYFVLNWCLLTIGEPGFTTRFDSRTPSFKQINQQDSLLCKLSMFTHDNFINGSTSLNFEDDFVASLGVDERCRFNNAIYSTPNSLDCLNGFSNGISPLQLSGAF